jgi:predicted phosphodiesterase
MDTREYSNTISRRAFLKSIALCAGVSFSETLAHGSGEAAETVRFGLITDVHQDIMHDGVKRVRAFVDAMNQTHPDFICQLGDFCYPDERNREFIEQWRAFKGPRYHALGNHDMDAGFSREQTVAFYEMPGRHYSFDAKGVHFIVLDGNDPGGTSTGYKRFIADDQLEWLRSDLQAAAAPVVVFSHQALDDVAGIENCAVVRNVLEGARTRDGRRKVVACFCGHHHDDRATTINAIHYIRINSASYSWLGASYKHQSYSEEIHQAHPWISHTAPYREPLWALVEINPAEGMILITGKSTEWVGPNPWELGIDEKTMDPATVGPRISDRALAANKERIGS